MIAGPCRQYLTAGMFAGTLQSLRNLHTELRGKANKFLHSHSTHTAKSALVMGDVLLVMAGVQLQLSNTADLLTAAVAANRATHPSRASQSERAGERPRARSERDPPRAGRQGRQGRAPLRALGARAPRDRGEVCSGQRARPPRPGLAGSPLASLFSRPCGPLNAFPPTRAPAVPQPPPASSTAGPGQIAILALLLVENVLGIWTQGPAKFFSKTAQARRAPPPPRPASLSLETTDVLLSGRMLSPLEMRGACGRVRGVKREGRRGTRRPHPSACPPRGGFSLPWVPLFAPSLGTNRTHGSPPSYKSDAHPPLPSSPPRHPALEPWSACPPRCSPPAWDAGARSLRRIHLSCAGGCV
jgi:hypothetical protein